MNKELKAKYKKDFTTVSKLVNEFDPCGLIAGGAPSDEYDCLTQQLLSFIYDKKSEQEIKALIIHEVDHHFGTPVEEEFKAKFNDDIDNFITTLKQLKH